MVKKILVALDGSSLAEAALPYAEVFATATKASVLVVRAIHSEDAAEPLPDENPQLLPFMVVMPTEAAGAETTVERNVRYDAEHYLDRIVKKLGENGIVATGRVVPGDPVKVVLEEVEAQGADLVVISTHGRSGLGRLIFGSIAEAIVAQSTVPVLLVRSAALTASRLASSPVLVPLDGTPQAARALPLATELTMALKTTLKLVEVVPPVASDSYVEGVLVYGDSPEMHAADRGAAFNYLQDLNAGLMKEGVASTFTVCDDEVGRGIAETATETQAGLVLMATHGDSPLARALIHSVAIDVLHRVMLPILLIGPKAK